MKIKKKQHFLSINISLEISNMAQFELVSSLIFDMFIFFQLKDNVSQDILWRSQSNLLSFYKPCLLN